MEPLARILARIEAIKLERSKLDAEEADLAAAVRVLRKYGPTPASSAAPIVQEMIERNATKAQIAVEVLQESSNPWMTANEVRRFFSEKRGEDTPMSSISPLLTKLKDDGLLVRNGLHVALRSRVQATEAPVSEPTEAP
jgi:hypothetical protein